MGRVVGAALMTICLVAGTPSAAQAAPVNYDDAPGKARIIQDGDDAVLVATITVGDDVGGPGENRPTEGTGGRALVIYYWRIAPAGKYDCAGIGIMTPDNIAYEYVRHDRSEEPPEITVVQVSCFRPESRPPTPPPPPPPPTMREISEAASTRITAPTIRINPGLRGLTGLDHWLWYDGPTEASTSASVRGYTITVTVQPVAYHWWMCDGCPVLSSVVPGSEENPARSYVYEEKGTHQITFQVVWGGSFTVTGPADYVRTGTVGTGRATSRMDYEVHEVRSAVVD